MILTSSLLKKFKFHFNLIKKYFRVDQKASDLIRIGLAGCKISEVNGSSKLSLKFPSLVELDLDENLLSVWSQIFTVLSELKNLKIFNVRLVFLICQKK